MSGKKGIQIKRVVEKKEHLTAKQYVMKRLSAILIRLIIESFAVSGVVVSASMALKLDFSVSLLAAAILFSCFVLEILFHFHRKYTLTFPAFAFVAAAVVFIFRFPLQQACLEGYNVISAQACAYFGGVHVAIPVETPGKLGMTGFLAMLSLVIAVFVVYVVKERGFRFVYVVATLPIAGFPYVLGLPVTGVFLLLYAGATLCVLGGRGTKDSDVNAESKKTFTETAVQGIILLVFSLIAVLLPVIYPESYYKEHFHAKEIKKSIQETMKDFEMDTLDFFGKGDSSASYAGGLNKGKLGWVDEVNYTQKEALVVTLPEKMEELSNQALYLRGYIGDVYTADKMDTLSREDRQAYEALERQLKTSLSEVSQKFLSLGITEEKMAGIYAVTGKAAGEAEHVLVMEDKNLAWQIFGETEKGDVLLEEDADQAIRVKNIWTDKEDYFVPYYTVNEMGRNHDGRIELGDDIEEKIEGESVSYQMDTWYPVYNSLYQRLRMGGAQKEGTFALTAIQENIVLKNAIEKYLGEDIAAYLASSGEETISITELLAKAGYPVPVNQLAALSQEEEQDAVSLSELAKLVETVDEYAALENQYRQWVYKTYTCFPENSSQEMLSDMKLHAVQNDFSVLTEDSYKNCGQVGGVSEQEISDAITYVRDYIGRDTEYSLSPGALPEGKDFVEYFLKEKKKGYCTHYAASGMLALRAIGIPARYVEGFIVADENYEGAKENGDGTISVSLKDVNAHSWVEIYVDGFGWYPVEMTPGFYSEDEGQEMSADERQGKKDKKKDSKKENKGQKEDQKDNTDQEKENSDGTDSSGDERDSANLEGQEAATPPPGMMEWAEEEYKDQLAQEDQNQKETDRTWLWSLLSCIGVFLLFVLAVLLQQHYIYRKTRQALNDKSFTKRILYRYLMLEKMLVYTLHLSKQVSLQELPGLDGSSKEEKKQSGPKAVFYEKRLEKWSQKEEIKQLGQISLKAYFSGQELTEEEFKQVDQIYQKFRNDLYREGHFQEKIYYRRKGF